MLEPQNEVLLKIYLDLRHCPPEDPGSSLDSDRLFSFNSKKRGGHCLRTKFSITLRLGVITLNSFPLMVIPQFKNALPHLLLYWLIAIMYYSHGQRPSPSVDGWIWFWMIAKWYPRTKVARICWHLPYVWGKPHNEPQPGNWPTGIEAGPSGWEVTPYPSTTAVVLSELGQNTAEIINFWGQRG